MPTPTAVSAPVANRLLSALPRSGYERLAPLLEHVALPLAKVLYEPGARIRHVYFPSNALISILSVEERERITPEVGVVGNEGMAGLPVFLEVSVSRNLVLVQVAGTALRMKAEALRQETRNGGLLGRLLRRYTHAFLTQVSCLAICNLLHITEARLARWLLMTQDRVQSDEFKLTQEFLAKMLGVRREGVTKAASVLQQGGLISYTRGNITILNRVGLEAAACGCYRTMREEYDSFLA